MKYFEELERSLKDQEAKMVEATRLANEKADALTKALEMLEVERAARAVLSIDEPVPQARPGSSKKIIDIDASLASSGDSSVVIGGNEWSRLFDQASANYYWYCEKTGESRWSNPAETLDEGYESSGALTDYSSEQYESGDDASLYSEYVDDDWQEFWDEAAQSKYWYNNTTVGQYVSIDRYYCIVDECFLGGGDVGEA
jgi:hypothetical protein